MKSLGPIFMVLLMGLFLSLPARAGSGSGPVNDITGTGLSGYDAVSYFEDTGPVQGLPKYAATHDGVVYLFASAAHRDSFVADPNRFLPQFGGYCSIATAHGLKVTVDPHAYVVIGGKLYLNHSMTAHQSFMSDPTGNIRKAETNWPVVQKIDGPDH